MQINLVGWQQLNRVRFGERRESGSGGGEKAGTEGGLIVVADKRGREKSM